jgi:hypothetical protein
MGRKAREKTKHGNTMLISLLAIFYHIRRNFAIEDYCGFWKQYNGLPAWSLPHCIACPPQNW